MSSLKDGINTIYMKESQKDVIINKNGPIIVIEDDADDQDFLITIFQKLNYQNKVLFFFDGQAADIDRAGLENARAPAQ